jgi:hypothetical protein
MMGALGSTMVVLLLGATPDAGVRTVAWDERSAVKLEVGETVVLTLKTAPGRVAASDGSICAVTSLAPKTLQLVGKRRGTETVALSYGITFRGLQVEVRERGQATATAPRDGGASALFTWDGVHGLKVPQGEDFELQSPGGLEKVAAGSHRRCTFTSLGGDRLRVRCDDAGPVTVFLWYANAFQRTLELDVMGATDAGLTRLP